jgi:hypothetical protein
MSSGKLLRLALLLLVAALLIPALKNMNREISEEPLDQWADRLMSGAFIVFGIAAVLAILEKFGLRVSGARCRDCRKPIEHGKLYCREHLRERVEKAREKYHGEKGMGI